jgi:alpha-glucosidase
MGAVAFPPGPPPFQTLNIAARTPSPLYFGGGGHAGQQLTRTSGSAHVANTDSVTPSYWSTDGYAALAVSQMQNSVQDFGAYPASWSTTAQGVAWTIQGSQVDLYLAPASSMTDGSRALWSLISPPPIPPRYAFGFLASRWGWSNASYIEDMMQQFRAGQFPIDAIISDFEWYASAQ